MIKHNIFFQFYELHFIHFMSKPRWVTGRSSSAGLVKKKVR